MITVVVGSAADSLRKMKESKQVDHIDFLFLDHVEDLYKQDLQVCDLNIDALVPCPWRARIFGILSQITSHRTLNDAKKVPAGVEEKTVWPLAQILGQVNVTTRGSVRPSYYTIPSVAMRKNDAA